MLIPPGRDEFIKAFQGDPSLRVLIYLIEDISNALNNITGGLEIITLDFSNIQGLSGVVNALGKNTANIENQTIGLSASVGRAEAIIFELEKRMDCLEQPDPLFSPVLLKLLEDFNKLKDFVLNLEQSVQPLFTLGIDLQQIQSQQLSIQNEIAGTITPTLQALEITNQSLLAQANQLDFTIQQSLNCLENYDTVLEGRLSLLEAIVQDTSTKVLQNQVTLATLVNQVHHNDNFIEGILTSVSKNQTSLNVLGNQIQEAKDLVVSQNQIQQSSLVNMETKIPQLEAQQRGLNVSINGFIEELNKKIENNSQLIETK